MAGRYRTPLSLVLLKGNPGKRPLRNEPRPAIAAECPQPPGWMPEYAQQEWARVAPELHRLGLLSGLDHAVMAAYCVAYSRWRGAEEALAAQAEADPTGAALTIRDRDVPRPNPLIGVARRAADQMIAFAGQLGATPIARTRLAAGVLGGPPGDGKFEGFLRG
jgi:P27 family predicted phage terminase small subunit